jgi:hypothetical protein
LVFGVGLVALLLASAVLGFRTASNPRGRANLTAAAVILTILPALALPSLVSNGLGFVAGIAVVLILLIYGVGIRLQWW